MATYGIRFQLYVNDHSFKSFDIPNEIFEVAQFQIFVRTSYQLLLYILGASHDRMPPADDDIYLKSSLASVVVVFCTLFVILLPEWAKQLKKSSVRALA